MATPDFVVPAPPIGEEQPADEQIGRRAVVAKLAYVVPAIVALEVARPAVALGRSGPAATRGKALGHAKGKGKGNDRRQGKDR
jgi:hypothetical protein